MSERVDVKQNFTPVELSQLLTKVKDLKDEGYRFAQACATVVDDKFEILYSFDKEYKLLNLRLVISQGEEVESITGIYWPAFIYEMKCATCSAFSSIIWNWIIRATSLKLLNLLHGVRRNRKGR